MVLFMIKLDGLKLREQISVPASKSHTMRALLFAFMADGRSVVENYLHSPDTECMLNLGLSLGAGVVKYHDRIEVCGVAGCPKIEGGVVDAGNSGLVVRFGIAMAALGDRPIGFRGDSSLTNKRPIEPLVTALDGLGVTIDGTILPLNVCGPINAYVANIDGEDSQPVSALLIALNILGRDGSISVRNPGEKPWIDVTLWWLKKLGYKISHEDYSLYHIEKSPVHKGFNYRVPADFSSAAYPVAAALIRKQEVVIQGLDFDDIQGDKKIIDILKSMGASFKFCSGSLTILTGSGLQGISIDVDDIIDALPLLAVLGCYAGGETVLYNAGMARHKESDRLASITKELKKMGADIDEYKDRLVIKKSKLKAAHFEAHDDHRIAMALIVASLGVTGESQLEGERWISKSYPNFMESLFLDNIIIIGFKSAGKSSYGLQLAQKMGRHFIDLDNCIEAAYNEGRGLKKTCREIYNEEGLSYFRLLEREAILSLKGLHGLVLATGGGVVEDKQSMFALLGFGKVCYLKVGFEEICSRLEANGWPSYAKDRAELRKVFDDRKALYMDYADEILSI